MREIPDDAVPAPRTRDLPGDALVLDGPESVAAAGGALALLPALEQALSRPGPAVVVSTSGSTGRPKRTVLSAQAVQASAEATAARTGGHGQWLLCLPGHYVAGLQVLARSVAAGTRPVEMPEGSFDPLVFARTAGQMRHPIRHVSLVPTQLARLVEAAEAQHEVLTALRSFSSILLGGSAASPRLLERARALGARVMTTYGMSETCGGCVYDGAPLDGIAVGIGGPSTEPWSGGGPGGGPGEEPGRIWLGGAVVADGYLDDPEQTARHLRVVDGVRWYRTDDLGQLVDGRLQIHGRTDDVLVTGGVKVSAGVVADCVRRQPGVADAVVVGLPDPQWGQAVAAVVIPEPSAPDPETAAALRDRLGAQVRQELGAAAVPKHWRLPQRMPLLPTGKPDRTAVRALFDAPPEPAPAQ